MVAPTSAGAAGSIRISKVEPEAAVSGAAIDLKGKGLKGKGTRVTLGGKKAKVLTARASRLRIVVPSVKPGRHKLVVKRGRRSASKRLRVLKPFKGAIAVTPDRARAKSGQVGPAGGELTATGADGTRYALRVPAGALAQEEAITVTPVKRFSGLPFSGKALGAELAPDGLQFLAPATLTITSSGPLPKGIVGFGYANSSRVLDVQPPSGSGRSRTLRIEHFSTGAVAGSNPADFANAVAPLLVEQPMREDVIERVLELRAVYEEVFGPAFCDTQPACGNAMLKGLQSLKTRIEGRCANPQNLPSLGAVSAILRMESFRRRLGAEDDLSEVCREQIMRLVFDPVKQAACGFPGPPPVPGDPLGRHSLIVNPALDEGAPSDLDRDGELTHLEFVHFLISQLALAGLDQMEVEARSCFNTALEGLPESGKTLCASDPPGESARRRAAEHNLKRALDYAQALQLVLQPYIDALDFCRVEVAVEPTSAVLQPGAQRQFAATVTGVLDEDGNGGVNWSATGGSITQGGLYTAPSAPGTYEVKATSAINSARSATAQVTVTPPGTVTVTVDDGSASGSAHVECAGLPGADDFDSDESTELSHTLTYHASVATTCNQDSHKADAQGTHTAAASASSITASASGGGSVESTASRRVSVGAGGNLRAIVDVDSGTLPYTVSGTVTSTSGGSRSLSAFGHRAGADGTLNVSGTLGPGRHEVSIGASCIRVLVSAGTDDCSYSYSLNVSLG